MNLIELIFKAKTSELKSAQKDLDGVAKSTEKAEKGTKDLKAGFDQLKGVGGPIGEIASKVGDLKDQAVGVGAAARSLPPLLLAATAAAAGLAAIRFAPVLDGLSDMAAQFGYTTAQAAALQDKLASAGGLAAFEKDLGKVSKALLKSGEDGSVAAEGLATLGVTVEGVTDPLTVASDVAQRYAEKISEGNVTTEEAVALQKLFGTQYQESVFRINEAADALERESRFREMGIGITKEAVAAANQFGDAQDDAAFALKTVGSQLVQVVVPAFTALIQGLVNSYKNGGLVATIFKTITAAIDILLVPVRALINGFIVVDALVQAITRSVGAMWEAIKTGSTTPLTKLKTDLKTILDDTVKVIENNKLLGGIGGTLEPPKSGGRVAGEIPTIPGKPKASTGPKMSVAGDADGMMKAYKQNQEDILRLWTDIENKAAQFQAKELAFAEAWRDKLDPVRVLNREIESINKNITLSEQEKAAAVEYATDKYKKQNEEVKKGQEEVNLGGEATKYVFGQVANTIGDAFTTGEFNFKSFLGTLLQGLAKLLIQLTVIEPLMKSLGSMGGGGGGIWGAIGNAFISMTGGFAMANGGAFNKGVQMFAKGGVVDSPTMFGMSAGRAGVMGEAGPEAIMPLKRGKDGKLGVAGAGGGGSTVVQNAISVQIGSVDSDERQAALINELNRNTELITKKAMADAMRPGGMLYARRNAMA